MILENRSLIKAYYLSFQKSVIIAQKILEKSDMANLSNLKHYLVGGAVRDKLLGIKQVDRDFVVIGQTPETMIQKGFLPVGKSFPVFLHPETREEYALSRTEKKNGPGHDAFICIANKTISLEEDLFRRDLTINAMAQDHLGKIIDPYGGQKDLKNRILRHVSEAFVEDPLRILRIARFAARFPSFHIHHSTLNLMKQMVQSNELLALSGERLWQELSRSLLETKPKRFFECLDDCGALTKLNWPACSTKRLDKIDRLPKKIAERWSSLSYEWNEQALNSLNKQLKIPKPCVNLSRLMIKFGLALEKLEVPSEGVRIWQQLDCLRHPNRFDAWIRVLKLEFEDDRMSIERLLKFQKISKALQAMPIPDTIKKISDGNQIKSILYQSRLKVYQDHLNKGCEVDK